MLQDSVKENAALRAEVSRYRGMIEYARAAPDFSSCKSILADALDGVNGAENYEEVKGERDALRARIAVLEKVVEWAKIYLLGNKHICPDDCSSYNALSNALRVYEEGK